MHPTASQIFYMYRRENLDQLSFKDFFLSFGGQLSGGNRWIKLAELRPASRQLV